MEKVKEIILNRKDVKDLLIYPKADANKYTRGRCFLIAGSNKYPGAAIMAAKASEKAGCGYTKLFTAKENVISTAVAIPTCPVDAIENFEAISKFDEKNPISYVVGPGFVPDDDKYLDIVCGVLESPCPCVVLDGGALNYLSSKRVQALIEIRNDNNLDTVLTPHTGEAEKVFGFYDSSLKDDPIKNALNLASLSKSIVVLKDQTTIVCQDNKFYDMKLGTPGLAKAGSGDVLAGIIGAFTCQNKISAFDCCSTATNIHAYAANLAVADLTEICVSPQDIIDYLPKAIKTL